MATPQLLIDMLKVASPHSYGDFAALGLVTFVTVGALSRGKLWDKPDPYHHLWFERPQEKDAAGRASAKETRNIAEKMEKDVCPI